ncbi:hypothetical protein LD85_3108 [Saccharolobus islandicus L.D.8.5]|uniref:Uncharacterized protein n=1 Tax=Saccharolobus islandicus (strain L.D.8.5 / Lassen \|nr:hypothetical protein LD85_3108 [Sulfolobus islandicus L.D.8.5]
MIDTHRFSIPPALLEVKLVGTLDTSSRLQSVKKANRYISNLS